MVIRRNLLNLLNEQLMNGNLWKKNLLTDGSVAYFGENFEKIPHRQKDKKTFHAIIHLFRQRKTELRGHVEFIEAALKNLESFGLHKDLETYKELLNIFPKGKMVPQNIFQRIFLHYPMQQICCVKLLDQMEWFGVQPDRELYDFVVNAFGDWNFATKKIKRMMYWMPKLKNTNKYLDRRHIEGKDLSRVQLAFIALKMMARDPGTSISYVKVSGVDVDENVRWLISAQSVSQKRLIEEIKPKTTIYIDGPKLVYVMDHQVEYVTMTMDPRLDFFDNFRKESDNNFENWHMTWEANRWSKRESTIHEQKDETILGLAVLGVANRAFATAWINHLQEAASLINDANVLFRIKEGLSLVINPSSSN